MFFIYIYKETLLIAIFNQGDTRPNYRNISNDIIQ